MSHSKDFRPALSADAARKLDVTPATIRNWAKSGKLPYLETPSGVRIFSQDDIDRLQSERRDGGEAA